MDNDSNKKFPHPLNVDIEEQTPVEKIEAEVTDKGTVKLKKTTVMQKRTVRYIDAPLHHVRCAPGQHVFRLLHMHKYLFKCVNCTMSQKVYPHAFRFEKATGKLIHRVSGQAI